MRAALFALLPLVLSLAACNSDSTKDSGKKCWINGDGCSCGDAIPDGETPFEGECSSAGLSARALCCSDDDSCTCRPVRCGISRSDGICMCGTLVDPAYDDIVDSCEGTASNCCTQDTGYCYCEDICPQRFENRIVSSCDPSTDTAYCHSGEAVESCD